MNKVSNLMPLSTHQFAAGEYKSVRKRFGITTTAAVPLKKYYMICFCIIYNFVLELVV